MRYYRTGHWRKPEVGEWFEAPQNGAPFRMLPSVESCGDPYWILRAEEEVTMVSVTGMDSAESERAARLKAEEALKQLQDALHIQFHMRLKAEDEQHRLKAHFLAERNALQSRIDLARKKLEEGGWHREENFAGMLPHTAWRILAGKEDE